MFVHFEIRDLVSNAIVKEQKGYSANRRKLEHCLIALPLSTHLLEHLTPKSHHVVTSNQLNAIHNIIMTVVGTICEVEP